MNDVISFLKDVQCLGIKVLYVQRHQRSFKHYFGASSELSIGAMAHLYLTDDISQTLAACIFTLDRFICNSFCDNEENLREIGVVWAEDNGIVAVKVTKVIRKNWFGCSRVNMTLQRFFLFHNNWMTVAPVRHRKISS